MGILKRIAILPGDGIGPEIIQEALKVLRAVEKRYAHTFELNYGLIGAAAIKECKNPYPRETHCLCTESDAVLFGAVGDPKYDSDPISRVRPEQGLLTMRKKLGLFANIRPIKSYKALMASTPLKSKIIDNVDFIICRELISGIYFGEPKGYSEDELKAFDTSLYSEEEILNITRLAFKYARNRRNKITLLDKANVLATSKLWRRVVSEYAKNYPKIEFETMLIDAAAMKIIQNPRHFDVILTENLFGDIISDEASVITGSIGILPSASIGTHNALYEPIHGSYPEGVGKNIANPIAAILSLAMMFSYSFNLIEENNTIQKAVEKAMHNKFITPDIKGGKCTTQEVGTYIAEAIHTV